MKKYFLAFIVSVLLFGGLAYMGDVTIEKYSKTAGPSARIDWIVILGNGPGLTQALKIRLDNAVLAHQLWPQARVLLTGNEEVNEISIMKEYLQDKIPAEILTEDSHSTTTWNSFKNIRKLISNDEFALIITNEFHQRRSIATANLMGFNAALFGKDMVTLDRKFYYAIREQFSAVKWYLQYLLHKQ